MILSNLIFMAQETACAMNRQRYLDYAVRLLAKRQTTHAPQRLDHIVFDLDGTLIDTEAAVLKAWQLTLREYRYCFAPEELRCTLGVTAEKALELLGVVVDADFGANWIRNYTRFASETSFFPGVREMLRRLKRCGCSLGVVTSRRREELETYFSFLHLEEFFDLMICADDTCCHKPEPEPLQQYARLACAAPSRCIYIGDMPTDLECAKRAGFSSGLVLWNNADVLSEEADYLFRTPEELLVQLL